MFIKIGEALNIIASDIQTADDVLSDPQILERFTKFAAELKVIAPSAKDFLYFTAVMMHAAEAVALDASGEIKKDAQGNQITFGWDVDDRTGSWKWKCSDVNIKPYKNSNGDIFPESELKKAHKLWVGKPLCIDHKSSSVDFVRGVIVDTYYDLKNKRVVALCALDKLNHGTLARQVETGVSAAVSMGCGVNQAICTDCGKVARAEPDFCHHMRGKSGYGEINVGLNPIELSIVVNGADPKAKIKHIIARDLSKAAEAVEDYKKALSTTGSVDKEKLAALQKDLQAITEKMNDLVVASSEDSNDTNYGTTGSSLVGTELEADPNSQQLAVSPSNRFAEKQLEELTSKVSQITTDLNKLIKMNEENVMTTKKGYYQGTVEPTPGRPQYPAGNEQETIRNTQDKQMVGASPFPGVGPVDGMYPGVGSESDEALKKRLQRLAELQDRQMRRQAALQKVQDQIDESKKAYWQGTEQPTPGKKQYPVDPLNVEDRNKHDKQMVGAPPFPGVGSVEGLYGDDEKEKEKLLRAGLKAKFLKAVTSSGAPDKGASCWQVYAGNNLILTATVNELTGGRVDALYDSIATKDFGLSMIGRIKSEGFDKAKALYKAGQVPAAAMGAGPGAVDAPGSGMPELEAPEGGGGMEEGSKLGELEETLDKASDIVSDMVAANGQLSGEADTLSDVKPAPEAAFADDAAVEKQASVRELQAMRKTLNGMLKAAMAETIEKLNGHVDELKIAAGMYHRDNFGNMTAAQKKYLNSLSDAALKDAKETMAESVNLAGAFVKYAHGTNNVKKRAAHEAALKKQAQGMPAPATQEVRPGEVGEATEGTNMGLDLPMDKTVDALKRKLPEHGHNVAPGRPAPAKPIDADVVPPPAAKPDFGRADDGSEEGDEACADDANEANLGEASVGPDGKVNISVASKFNLNTKEGRAQYRAKLAQKGIKWNEMLGKAHPGGGHTPGGLDTKPSGNLAEVETLEEQHSAMMSVVEATPKAKKQAQRIAQLVAEGKIAKEQVDGLVAHGVDAEAIRYYKEMWSDADADAKGWAGELVKEHANQKKAEAEVATHAKIKRAYDLAYEMREKGMIEESQVKVQVDDMLKYNDEAFESIKRMVTKQASLKKHAMPSVGMMSSGEIMLPGVAEESYSGSNDLVEAFESYFAGKKH